MPGQHLHTVALVLDRRPAGSDSFEHLQVFSAEHGLLACLQRLPRGPARTPAAGRAAPVQLDWCNEAELWLESSNHGRTWFVKESRVLAPFAGVGRSYPALAAAGRIAVLVTRNPVAGDSHAAVFTLVRQSLAALDQGGKPDLVWLKALYRFLRDEGLPVKQHWWTGLPAAERERAVQLLNQPVAEQSADDTEIRALVQRLEAWVRAETEVRLK